LESFGRVDLKLQRDSDIFTLILSNEFIRRYLHKIETHVSLYERRYKFICSYWTWACINVFLSRYTILLSALPCQNIALFSCRHWDLCFGDNYHRCTNFLVWSQFKNKDKKSLRITDPNDHNCFILYYESDSYTEIFILNSIFSIFISHLHDFEIIIRENC